MIYRANQLTGFYVMDSLILYGLNAGQIQKYDTRTETFYKTLFSWYFAVWNRDFMETIRKGYLMKTFSEVWR